MKKSTTPTIKTLAMETTAHLNKTMARTTINTFENFALLSAKAFIDSYEWLLYAVGKTYDVYTILEVQYDFEDALRCVRRIITNVEMNNYNDTVRKAFSIGNIGSLLNTLKYLIGKTEKINEEAKRQCEKAWHEYENVGYWLYFLKKKMHETT